MQSLACLSCICREAASVLHRGGGLPRCHRNPVRSQRVRAQGCRGSGWMRRCRHHRLGVEQRLNDVHEQPLKRFSRRIAAMVKLKASFSAVWGSENPFSFPIFDSNGKDSAVCAALKSGTVDRHVSSLKRVLYVGALYAGHPRRSARSGSRSEDLTEAATSGARPKPRSEPHAARTTMSRIATCRSNDESGRCFASGNDEPADRTKDASDPGRTEHTKIRASLLYHRRLGRGPDAVTRPRHGPPPGGARHDGETARAEDCDQVDQSARTGMAPALGQQRRQ